MIRLMTVFTAVVASALTASAGWTPTGVGRTGTTYWPQVSPHGGQQEMYINTDMGEVFHTTDFGDHWNTLNFGLGLGDPIIRFTADPKQRFAYDANRATFHQSTDGGKTWSTKGLALPPQGCSEPGQWFIDSDAKGKNVRMIVRGRNDNKLYLSSDSGKSWRVMKGGSTVTWISGVFFNGDDMYIGIHNANDVAGTGMWKFTKGEFVSNLRAGLGGGEGISSLAGVNTGKALRFIVLARAAADVSNSESENIWGQRNKPWNLYYLDTAGGGQWVKCNGSIPAKAQVTQVKAGNTPGGPGTFYLFGMDPTVYKTTGGTWTWSSNPFTKANMYSGYAGVGPFFGVCYNGVSAVNPDVVVVMDTSNVWGSRDGAKTWYCLDCDPAYRILTPDPHPANSMLNETSVWGINFIDPSNLFVYATDTEGFHSTDGGKTWALPKWGPVADNTSYASCTGPDGIVYEADAYQHDLFNQIGDGWSENTSNIGYSTDHGATWAQLSDFDGWESGNPNNLRDILAPRMFGGMFQGSNDKTNWTTLHTIAADEKFSVGKYNAKPISGTYRYVRYLSPKGGHGIIGGMEFSTAAGPLLYSPQTVDEAQPALAAASATYSGTLQHRFVTPGSFRLEAGINGGGLYMNDDGLGKITVRRKNTHELVPTTSATIDYATGKYSITLKDEVFVAAAPQAHYAWSTYGTISDDGGVLNHNYACFGPHCAFDNSGAGTFDARTYYRANRADGAWVGMDFGNPQALSQVKYGAPMTAGLIKAVAIPPGNPNRMYVLVCNVNTQDIAGVWYSDNFRSVFAGGSPSAVTWTRLGTGLNGMDSAGVQAPNGKWHNMTVLKDGTVILVAVARVAENCAPNSTGSGVWVLPAGKTTWENRTGYYNGPKDYAHMNPAKPGVPLEMNPYGMGWNFNQRIQSCTVCVSPLDLQENTWYLCVGRNGACDTAYGLYLTTDRGQNWVKLTKLDAPDWGAYSLAINPVTTEMFVASNGLWYSPTTSKPVFKRISEFPFWERCTKIQFNPFNPNQVWACTFGNGIYRADLNSLNYSNRPKDATLDKAPKPPTGLAVSASGTTYNLTWKDADSNVTGYQVEFAPLYSRTASGLVPWTVLAKDLPTAARSYSATIAKGDTAYIFRVLALSKNGTSSSDYAYAAIPLAPSNPSAVGVSSDGIVVHWQSNSVSETGFAIEKSANGAGNWTEVGTVGARITRCIAGGLAPDKACYFRVRAIGVNGNSDYTAPVSARTFTGTAMIAYEPFDYPYTPGASADGNLSGKSGGEGWTDAWSPLTQDPHGTIRSGSLAAPAVRGLAEIGNSVTNHDTSMVRHTKAPFGKPGTTLWVSFVIANGEHPNGGIGFGKLQIGVGWGGKWGVIVPGNCISSGEAAPKPGATNLVVARIKYGTTNSLTLWIDPTPGTEPAEASAAVNGSYIGDLGISNVVEIPPAGYLNVTGYDEIRMGASYLDVAPPPARGDGQNR
ncbi:MAG: hypothetical protein ABSF26_13300 [Thermoguttaceae bacterium]|jgi:hypothetical protein